MMIIAHAGLCAIELFVYEKVLSVPFEILYGWLAFYCYMTLNTCAIYSYIAMLALTIPMGIFGCITMLFNGILSAILYPC